MVTTRGIIPRTLIPAATAASNADTLRSMATQLRVPARTGFPGKGEFCHSVLLARYAEQIRAGLSAAAAVAAWAADVPTGGLPAPAECSLAECTLHAITLAESTLAEPAT